MTKERHTVWSRINEGKANEVKKQMHTYMGGEKKKERRETESTWKAGSAPVPGLYRHRSEGMLSARLEQPSHRDLGIEHCRERTTMRWDCMRQDGTDYRNFQGLAKWHQHDCNWP